MGRSRVSPEALREFLDYDPETGFFAWRERDKRWFKSGRFTAEVNASRWNTRYAGAPAFRAKSCGRYLSGGILGQTILAHRAAWAIYYGEWPEHEIDHINGDGCDNRIRNLRSVTHAENVKNAKIRSDNTSGVCGVRFRSDIGKWNAAIYTNGRQVNLGWHAEKASAISARREAEGKLGYHDNHGKTAKARLASR